MSRLDSRLKIIWRRAEERAQRQKRDAPKLPEVCSQREIANCYTRLDCRSTRKMWAYLEKLILEVTEGHPVSLDAEMGKLFGLPDLWRTWQIKRENHFLPAHLDTAEQEQADEDLYWRWCQSQGLALDVEETQKVVERENETFLTALQQLRQRLGLEARELVWSGGGDT